MEAGNVCVYRDKETGGCWWARGDFTVCVWTCVRGGFMSHRQTRVCRAGSLHHGRPNAKGRDTSERGGGGWHLHPSTGHDERGKTPAQATKRLAVTAEVSKLDARFATRCKDLHQPGGTPLPAFQLWNNVTPAFIRGAFPFLHGQTRPHDAHERAGDLPVTAVRIFTQPGKRLTMSLK